MRILFRRLTTAAFLAMGFLAVPALAHAQISSLVPNTGQPISRTVGFLQNAATVGQGRFLASPARFYGAYGGGGGGAFGGGFPGYFPGWYGPYSDYSPGNTLQGAASVIGAQGQFNIQNQQAKLAQQQVEQEKIKTRRAQFDQYLYEKANTPTLEDLRQKMMEEELRRVRNDPPPSEIWSGVALNTLLRAIQKEEAYLGGVKGPAIPIDPTILAQVQLTGGVESAGVGVIKGGQVDWPLSLQTEMFTEDRKKIDGLVSDVVKQATAGRINGPTLAQLQGEVTAMKAKVKSQIDAMLPSDNVRANRFCNELLDATRSLADPSAINHFNGKWDVKAATVPELIGQMSQQGLTFAPSAGGDEAAYTAVYRAIAAYDVALNQMTAKLQSPGVPPKQ